MPQLEFRLKLELETLFSVDESSGDMMIHQSYPGNGCDPDCEAQVITLTGRQIGALRSWLEGLDLGNG